MSNVYVVYAAGLRQLEYFAYHDYVLEAFARAGATVVEEATFLNQPSIDTNDKLVGFFINDHNAKRVFDHARPENRWTYAIDERATQDGGAYHGRIEFSQRHGIQHIVVTFQNEQHLSCLRAADLNYVVMPCCIPRRRPRIEKSYGVFAAGAFDPAAYVTRFRVRNLLAKADNWSGRTVHMYIEPATGDKYYDTVDQYQLGLVCRASFRDRMVQKYVEFGMCHVLPVGDCPTYMPDDLKKIMVNVEGMSDDAIIAEVRRLLTNHVELYRRQEAYSEAIHRYYDLDTHAQRVINTIKANV